MMKLIDKEREEEQWAAIEGEIVASGCGCGCGVSVGLIPCDEVVSSA